jgi:hypothetical protein
VVADKERFTPLIRVRPIEGVPAASPGIKNINNKNNTMNILQRDQEKNIIDN